MVIEEVGSELTPESRLWLFKAGGRLGEACTLAPIRGQPRTAAIKAGTSMAVLGTSVPSLTPQTEKGSIPGSPGYLSGPGHLLGKLVLGPGFCPPDTHAPLCCVRWVSSSHGGTSCSKGLDTHVTRVHSRRSVNAQTLSCV